MFIFEENYYQYDIVYLKSAIRLLEAGSRDGAFEMYLRYLISNRVIPSDKSVEDILREHFWYDRDEYEGWCQTVEDLRNRISMIRDEAYRGLIGDLPEKFLKKYFTPDVMMELLEEQFLAEGNHREITAIIEAREKYYLSKLTEA